MHSDLHPFEVGTDTLAAALEEGATLIDVREPDEYVAAHVPGAKLVPLGELGRRLGEISTDGRVYVICAVGGRSFAAASALVRAGLDAVSVAGGTNAWVAEGRPVVEGLTER